MPSAGRARRGADLEEEQTKEDESVLTRRTTSVLSLESGSSSGVGGRGRFGAWLESSPPPPALRLLIAIATASRGLQQRQQKQNAHQSDDEKGMHAFRLRANEFLNTHKRQQREDGIGKKGQKGLNKMERKV